MAETKQRSSPTSQTSPSPFEVVIGGTPLKDVESQESVALLELPSPTSAAMGHSTLASGCQNMKLGPILSCMLYSTCSVSMVLSNKSLASSYNDLIDGDLNILLVFFQAIVAVAAVDVCKRSSWVEYPAFNWRTALQWAPVNVFFCLMLFTGMASLQHNTVPMVTVFKNVANIFTTFGDWYFYRSPVSFLVILSFLVMLGGACAAAKHDAEITPLGIFWMIANCLCTAGYVLYMKHATQSIKLSKWGMVFYNNLLAMVFLLPMAVFRGEASTFLKTPAIHTLGYLSKNVYAGFVGFFLNFASLTCVQATGPTTYAIVGSLNKIPTTIIGYFLFKTVITHQTWFFIGINILGGFIYSYAKIREKQRNEQK
mmetsp:Transcript_3939/g.7514  ORF Transcript_3939/g.7514 Transcript_3939/m.7514 type:complete len:369 (-) Transcript_3939:354-1460(-)